MIYSADQDTVCTISSSLLDMSVSSPHPCTNQHQKLQIISPKVHVKCCSRLSVYFGFLKWAGIQLLCSAPPQLYLSCYTQPTWSHI